MTRNTIESVQLVGLDGEPVTSFETDDTAVVLVHCTLSASNRFLLAAEILWNGIRIHQTTLESPLPRGRGRAELCYRSLNLLKGSYDLRLVLLDRLSGEEVSSYHHGLDVISQPRQGAGLAFNPCRWEISRVPASDRARGQIHIGDVRVLDQSGRECAEFQTGDAAAIAICLQVAGRIEQPLVRIQVFNVDNPDGEKVFVCGWNTDLLHDKIDALDSGAWDAYLSFGRLNLLPGEYRITVGVWTGGAQAPVDIRHGWYVFHIPGDRHGGGAKVHIPVGWTIGPAVSDVGSDRDQIEQLTVSPTVQSLRSMRLRVRCAVGQSGRRGLAATIIHEGIPAHHVELEEPLPSGRRDVDVTYDPVHLLGGDYRIRASLIDVETGEAICGRETTFVVQNPETHGGGLVYQPFAWELAPRNSMNRTSRG